MQFLSPEHLKTTLFSVLLSNPLTKDDFPFRMGRTLVHVVVVSLLDGQSNPERRSPANCFFLHTPHAAVMDFCCRSCYGRHFGFWVYQVILQEEILE
jgi:hypothetical protein